MWTHYFYLYCFTVLGVYCFVLPPGTSAIKQQMKFSSSKELRFFASDISNNRDFRNDEFKALLKPLLIPRMPGTDNSLIVQEYIKDHFNKLNWQIEEDKFETMTPYGMKPFNNIIVTLDPDVKNKMVLSCHYDSKNISDSRGNFLVAATDSAVPCAILMDVANKLDCALQHKRRNRKRSLMEDTTLQIMFFDGEEAYKDWTATDSLYGSRHLAERLHRELDESYPNSNKMDNIELFVLLDLIGSEDVVFKKFSSVTDAQFKHLQKIEKSLRKVDSLNPKGLGRTGEKVLFSSARPWGAIEDDHKPFEKLRRDLPILHLISTPFPRVWHTMADNENAINYDVTDNFNRIFRVFVANYLQLQGVTCRK